MKIKIVIFLVLTLSLLLSFCICSFAYMREPIRKDELITDRNDLIPDEDELEIQEFLRTAKQNCGADIRVYAYRGAFDYTFEEYLEDSDGDFESLVLLVIQQDPWGSIYYYVDTVGGAEYDIGQNEANRILDNSAVYDNLKSGNFKDGISAFAELSATAVSGRLRPSFGKTLIISLIIAAVASIVAALSVYFAYKKKLHSESYPLGKYASLDLQIERDSFITKFITRVRIRSSDGGGGRRSGGGRSGGGSRRGGR